VPRKVSFGFIVFGIMFASALVTAHDGRGNGKDGDDNDRDEVRIRIGFDIAPVALHFKKKDRDLVGLGSYIVNAQSVCSQCHTNPPFVPGGDPFLGQPKVVNAAHYLAGGMAFGPFISRNITPDPTSGLPANLTFEQFRLVLRTGVDLDKTPPNVPSATHDLLQVMPWPVFQNMTDHDLLAIYKYLSAIPHAEPGP